jgi:hypothetical protein
MYNKVVTGIFLAIICPVLVLIFCTSSFAAPQWLNAPAGEMPKAFMAYEDGNGDGKVTREEYKGPDPHWVFFDKNKDGFITIDEAPRPYNLPEGIGNAPEPGEADSAVSAKDAPKGEELMGKLDKNKDGKISLKEWETGKGPSGMFEILDKNKDGNVVIEEIPS